MMNALLFLGCASIAAQPPAVVINEVFYNAPNDLDRVQWIELHNLGDEAVSLGGWTIDQGKLLTVAKETAIPPKGYIIFALDLEQFAQAYGEEVRPLGPLARALRRGGERLELRDERGTVVDVVRYKDASPFPVSADGRSASLERICPSARGDVAENWSGSPLPELPRPAGTPGKANACYCATLPPVIAPIPEHASSPAGQPLRIAAQVSSARAVRQVALFYRAIPAADGEESPEVSVEMVQGSDAQWAASIPAHPSGTLLRYRVRATDELGAERWYPAATELRPTLSTYVHDAFAPAPLPQALLILGGLDRARAKESPFLGPEGPRGPGVPGGAGRRVWRRDIEKPARAPGGQSAFIHVDPKSGAVELLDFIHATPRAHRPGSGFILHFSKDRPFHGQTAVSVFFEGSERWLLAEALSYDVYRRAGNAAPLTEFVRLSVNGARLGFYLMVERPNKSFLRRNGLDTGGNLYKVGWVGRGLIGTHTKKTNVLTGHQDLVEIVAQLQETNSDPDAQWQLIQKEFDVDQAATHFAVNVVLSHWDGYFNNYFAYHDTQRGKWVMFPWDHDQTWGEGGGGKYPLTELPLFYGSEEIFPPGDTAPGDATDGPRFRGRRPGWWRPGGVFSKPLLANPHFRKVYVDKVRKILDEVFTEPTYLKILDELEAALAEDAALRAEARGGGPATGKRQLANHMDWLRMFITRRREFLLSQKELSKGQ